MPTRHELLFERYAHELAGAREHARAWWRELLAREAARVGSPDAARAAVAARWPAGPAGHPRVVEVFRRYWIACARLNREIEREVAAPPGSAAEYEPHALRSGDEREAEPETVDELPVPPPVFVYEWLADRNDELSAFLAAYTYSPIGRDDEDEAV